MQVITHIWQEAAEAAYAGHIEQAPCDHVGALRAALAAAEILIRAAERGPVLEVVTDEIRRLDIVEDAPTARYVLESVRAALWERD
jgi:hypothetical protein